MSLWKDSFVTRKIKHCRFQLSDLATRKPHRFGLLISYLMLVAVSLSLSGCSGSNKGIHFNDTKAGLNPPDFSARDGVLYFDGKINRDTYDKLADLLNQQDIRRLSINSTGGDVEAAMKIARVIFDRKMDVEVRSLCASLCANYIFPAGHYKILYHNSIIIWHGSISAPSEYYQYTETPGGMTKEEFFNSKKVKAFQHEEQSFSKEIGVNYRMPFCPQLKKTYRKDFPYGWYSYSIQDMKKFGVKNIFISESPSQWYRTMREYGVNFANYCNKD